MTRTEWTWKDGRKTKIVQRFQVKSITTRVAKRTYPRKEWPRFGDAKDELFKGDEQFVTVEDPNVLTEEEPAADMKGLGIIMQKLQARKKGLIARSGPEDSFMNYDDSQLPTSNQAGRQAGGADLEAGAAWWCRCGRWRGGEDAGRGGRRRQVRREGGRKGGRGRQGGISWLYPCMHAAARAKGSLVAGPDTWPVLIDEGTHRPTY